MTNICMVESIISDKGYFNYITICKTVILVIGENNNNVSVFNTIFDLVGKANIETN